LNDLFPLGKTHFGLPIRREKLGTQGPGKGTRGLFTGGEFPPSGEFSQPRDSLWKQSLFTQRAGIFPGKISGEIPLNFLGPAPGAPILVKGGKGTRVSWASFTHLGRFQNNWGLLGEKKGFFPC